MYSRGLPCALVNIAKCSGLKTGSFVRSKLYYVKGEISSKRYISLTNLSFKNEETVEIGGVMKTLSESLNKELIPTKFGNIQYL